MFFILGHSSITCLFILSYHELSDRKSLKILKSAWLISKYLDFTLG